MSSTSATPTFAHSFLRTASTTERLPIKHLCLEVADIDEVIQAVRSKGWEISEKKLGGDHAWQSWIADPSGVQIELHQYTPESSHFTGEPCIVDW